MTKPSRNDPCPCGSGKKFKKCCENQGARKTITTAQVITGPSKMATLFSRHVQQPLEK